ncbi:MAG TPA: 2-oxo-4-hydroxy-4-carboxy-5-ureidoimidazoline decarboxylase [Burkholderiaceae bacterium]|jgi:2-oxo-4-hydroxy-4-carboxy-5-ureidoimidazoline decarboxylase|nr:2-oxo-4-hydroxy-4-carboxy-5-ureidoimidazoline decarboxylase [Burkholderiaceae bacterium]
MAEAHAVLNALAPEDARAALGRCCGSSRWVTGMLARRPWPSTGALHADADQVWGALERADFLEAFAHHPRIGGSGGDGWARQEQGLVASAAAVTQAELRQANERYLARFGYIFIVCATGKSAAEMLALLEERLPNDPAPELAIAAREQARITHLRLEKLVT